MSLNALGGEPLVGDRWLRALYLDETGVGKMEHEPLLVVAGLLIHADSQWRAICNHLRDLLQVATPIGQPVPSHFHTKHVFHGNGEFPREHWSQDRRWMLMDHVAAIPRIFGVPVIWGGCDRKNYLAKNPNETPIQQLIDCYAVASMSCFLQLEWYMRNCIGDDEIASITIEKNSSLQKRVHEVLSAARTQHVLDEINEGDVSDLLPITRVMDAPSFQEKSESGVLQVADMCAWAFQRAAMRREHHKRFAAPLAHVSLLWRPGLKPPISAPIWGEKAGKRWLLGRNVQ